MYTNHLTKKAGIKSINPFMAEDKPEKVESRESNYREPKVMESAIEKIEKAHRQDKS